MRGLGSVGRGEGGIALPLALLGLVSMSLLATTALITSSTELAISTAHRSATAALYSAEGGLQAYVAGQGAALERDAGRGEFEFRPAAGGPAVVLSVVHLGSTARADGGTLRFYSLVARQAGREERAVSAMVTQVVPGAAPPLFYLPVDTTPLVPRTVSWLEIVR
jgi:hypothetical protein